MAYRELLRQRRQVLQEFEHIDLILTPTTPVLPPSLSGLQAAPGELRNKELLMLRNTRPFNVYGLPAVSLTCGFSKTGLPIGLQITGAPGADGVVLALAHTYQKQSDWHKKKPAIGVTAALVFRHDCCFAWLMSRPALVFVRTLLNPHMHCFLHLSLRPAHVKHQVFPLDSTRLRLKYQVPMHSPDLTTY